MRRIVRARWIAGALSLVLTAGLAGGVEGPAQAQAAGGPSVEQAPVPSVPATPETRTPPPTDHTSGRELRGNQEPPSNPPKEGGGMPTATSLSASATWNVSEQTGDFTWSYPLRVPPAPGGLQPSLSLGYSSSAVDGRTSSTNNQPSWVGDGWDLNVGFVERSYGSCAADKEGSNPGQQVGDLCWRSDNATAAYNGGGGQLILGANGWRAKSDDGSRIERLPGAGNGARNGEYWKITTVDGTQYFFGSRPEAQSTWTVPVYGDDTGEPCHSTAGFAASSCTQAWRWNLDKVIDAHGNMILYGFETETNSYGKNLQDAAVSYIRGGWLRQIDYGLHTEHPVPASGRVLFGVADRCVPGSPCTFANPANWPDTALSERCDTPTCPGKYSPTFWSTKRLANVTTQVLRGGSYTDVDRWALDQSFPDPGDGDKPALWLKSITHTGLVGGSETLPPVTFAGRQMANRVVQGELLSPIIRYRITGIVSESGGSISVNYAAPDCTTAPTSPESNTKRCFPVRWAKPGVPERTDYFHKYVVDSVVSSDRISSGIAQHTGYEYLDGAAWHYDTSEFTPPDKKTWNEYRGFGRVRVRTGVPNDPGGSPTTMTEQRFHRGMHGDKLSSGTRSVDVTDSEGGKHPDHDWLNGFALESISYLGESGPVVSKAITTPDTQGPTASRDTFHAYIVRPGVRTTYTPLESGGRRVTKSQTKYDDRGLPILEDDLGDLRVASDDLCTRTTYVRNPDAWLLSLPSRVWTDAVHCGATPSYPKDAVSDQRTYYDNQDHGAVPTDGNPTKTEVLDRFSGTEPGYAVAGTAAYDDHGRPVQSADALGRISRMAYGPALGGPTTKVTATNPKSFVVSTELEPAFGQPVKVTDPNDRITETTYDALGRATQVWLPDRRRAAAKSPHYRFSYQVRREEPTVVTTERLMPNGVHVAAKVLYDGLLRIRQTQAPVLGGGRMLTDTRYDTHGRAFKSTQPYFNDGSVDSTLWRADDTKVPGSSVTTFDGAGRPVTARLLGGAVEKWRTTMTYGGDRVHVTPPAGGTPTTTVTDARGRTVELHQHRASTATGPADQTRYAFTPAGQLSTLTDPAGNRWSYGYDLRGRQIRADDPDKGLSTATYDIAGRLTSSTEARGQVLAHGYDELDRRTTIRSGGPSGRLLGQWTYDTVANGKGLPATAISYDAQGNPFTNRVDSYSPRNLPFRTSVVIPESEGLLAGTYSSSVNYLDDGSTPGGQSFAAIGDLPGEDVNHQYDAHGRPIGTTGELDGGTVTYSGATDYTRLGEVQRVELGSGTRRAWLSYYYDDHTRRPNRIIVDAEVPRPMQADLNYTYDPAGNITSIANTPLEQAGDTQCFRYDYLRRLTEAWTPGNGCAAEPTAGALAGPAPYWQSFRYDLVGNRLSETRHSLVGDVTRSYTHPASGTDANRPHALSAVTTSGPSGTSENTFSYDPAGNMTRRGAQQLTWDELGHLATLTENLKTTSHVYDAGGQRLLRRDESSTTLYLGTQELRLEHATGEMKGTRYYRHGGGVVAVRTKSGLTWLAGDHQGTAQFSINASTLNTAVRRQDPFGNPRGAQPIWPTDRGFVDGTNDPSGLTHLGAREYDPTLGRFISVDSILAPDEPQQLHAYAYAYNNPVSASDPSGLIPDYCGVDVECNGYGPSTGCPGGCGTEENANWGTINKAETKLNTPAKNSFGTGPSKNGIGFLKSKGYRGSDKFTYADVFEFAAQGDEQRHLACIFFEDTADECFESGGRSGGLFDVLVDVAFALLPSTDVANCVNKDDSCIWLLANVVPPSKSLKIPKAAAKAAESAKTAPKITQHGVDHSFGSHAAEWFGREVTATAKKGEWKALLERGARSTKVFDWSSGTTATRAHLSRIEGKWFVVQFDRTSGDLVTAFLPKGATLSAMLKKLGN